MFFLEPYVKVSRGVIGQPGEEELVGLGDPPRRVPQAFPFRVIPYGDQYLLYGVFDPGPVYPMFRRIRSFRLFRASVRQLHGKGELLVGCSSPVS